MLNPGQNYLSDSSIVEVSDTSKRTEKKDGKSTKERSQVDDIIPSELSSKDELPLKIKSDTVTSSDRDLGQAPIRAQSTKLLGRSKPGQRSRRERPP